MHSPSVITAARKIRYSKYYPAVLFTVFLGALLLRCWPRLVSPQVWAEDGTQVLYGFINSGWGAFFQPVNGYLVLMVKLISATALSVSIYHYPLISIILSCLFAVLVGLAVALSPTVLRGKFFCALAIFLVPSDAEVFGLPLYALWWTGILLLLLVLWDEKHTSPIWRTGFLLIGGLSTPIVVMILPLLYYRVFLYRGARVEQWLALLATSIALWQLSFMIAGPTAQMPALASLALYIVPKFLGGFLLGNIGGNLVLSWLFGVALIACILLWFRYDTSHKGRWVLLYLLAGVIALSVVRIDPAVLNARYAGPRYFYYPFVVLLWILIQIYSVKIGVRYRRLATGIIALAMINMMPVLTRFHEDLDWQAHLRSCRLFPEYNIPVELDGKQIVLGWELKLKREGCDSFLRRDSFVSMAWLEQQPTFPYSVQRANWKPRKAEAELVAGTMAGSGLPIPAIPGFRIVSSYDTGGASAGEIRLRLKQGASLLYRSGPDRGGQHIQIEGHEQQFLTGVPVTSDWIELTFANMNLPAEFVVRVQDTGAGQGQWSAIALPEITPLP